MRFPGLKPAPCDGLTNSLPNPEIVMWVDRGERSVLILASLLLASMSCGAVPARNLCGAEWIDGAREASKEIKYGACMAMIRSVEKGPSLL